MTKFYLLVSTLQHLLFNITSSSKRSTLKSLYHYTYIGYVKSASPESPPIPIIQILLHKNANELQQSLCVKKI